MVKYTAMAALLSLSFIMPASAIIIRHDAVDTDYLIGTGPTAMVDLRYEGHGVLISSEWIVTVAHTVFGNYQGNSINVGGKDYEIAYVIRHPDYHKIDPSVFVGDAAPSQALLRANHDIALIKLTQPVTCVKPMSLYTGKAEIGQTVSIYGKGTSGNGQTGQTAYGRGQLRRAKNRIDRTSEQWISYTFDQGENALPLEGIQGGGDSGGPALLKVDGMDQLIGLSSWISYDGDMGDFQAGVYGLSANLVRLNYYSDWIGDIQSLPTSALQAQHYRAEPAEQ
ncbi:MAG: trypsin-like serine protease [Henriciella sp.]|nr:trypsin-like serine protease [Henriciella sp.]